MYKNKKADRIIQVYVKETVCVFCYLFEKVEPVFGVNVFKRVDFFDPDIF